jgi:uncharacterized protein (DUF1800 family)
LAVPVYRGAFGPEQAERLLWRAGFGPRPGEAQRYAAKGLTSAVFSLTRPTVTGFIGPAPHDGDGNPLAPIDAWGHDHAWWLDRMVRTRRPLVERMTLIWHDWFATSNDGVGSQRLMLQQNALFRRYALGSFADLLYGVTRDPAMLLWLSGNENTRWSPNENYARELMELFTLGADRGYSERDVRQQARALTGWTNDWAESIGPYRFRYEPEYHDPGYKRIFGHVARFNWRDACRLCLQHPSHGSFFVKKLWSYFVPTPPSSTTQRELVRMYKANKYAVRPVLEAILRHPAFYTGPRMVKPPVVYTAGMLRALGAGIDTDGWAWRNRMCGQQLFYPPNVAGWDDGRWLDTSTFRGRWEVANRALMHFVLDTDTASEPYDAQALVDRALAFWRNPRVTAETRGALLGFAERALATADQQWKRTSYPVLVQNALRQLIAVSPDFQTC